MDFQITAFNLKNRSGLIKFENYGSCEMKVYAD